MHEFAIFGYFATSFRKELLSARIGRSKHLFCQSFSRQHGKDSDDVLTASNAEIVDASAENEELSLSDETSLTNISIPDTISPLLSVQVNRRPVFPGFYKTITVKDPNVLRAMKALIRRRTPYMGIFLHSSNLEHGDVIKSMDDIHKIGVMASIINFAEQPTIGGAIAVVFPQRRIRAMQLLCDPKDQVSRLQVENISDLPYDKKDQIIVALRQEVYMTLADIAKINTFFREHLIHHNIPVDVFENPSKLADFVAVLCSCEPHELQDVLDTLSVEERLQKVLVLLKKELIHSQLQQKIREDVETKVNQRQREYFLHEQLKSIKKELGIEQDSKEKLRQTFLDRAALIEMPEAAKKVFEEELIKLSTLEPAGAEFNVTRNYLDWLTQLPWGKFTQDSFDLAKARGVLEEDHYGMEDVKKRILEFMAVAKLKGTPSGKILCFVGPPGVGKTSIGKSIARALDRKFFRFSVGGLHDVAEIKGHRRTYVGAMPGKLIQALKKVESENPVIMIDEIDKLGRGHTGDPASALLELLDPEQNSSFLDHYLDIPLDLSKVLFICTANVLDTIPGPLLDRMEVITLSGYISEEKREIAKRYLIPQVLRENGISTDRLVLKDEAIDRLNKSYCRESGVRNLKNQLDKIVRKVALKIVEEGDNAAIIVDANNIRDFIGPPVFLGEKLYREEMLPAGVCTGLAWTSLGGSILYFESLLERHAEGKNRSPSFIRTGQLGKVMEESSSIAYSYSRSFITAHYPKNDFFDTSSIHLHVPEGATPKDGPSAGVTMTASILSLALKRPIRSDLAMTGELSLTGKVMKVGGIREKIVAARRSGIKMVILPRANESDWTELPDYLKSGLEVIFAEEFNDIAKICKFFEQ